MGAKIEKRWRKYYCSLVAKEKEKGEKGKVIEECVLIPNRDVLIVVF